MLALHEDPFSAANEDEVDASVGSIRRWQDLVPLPLVGSTDLLLELAPLELAKPLDPVNGCSRRGLRR